MILLACGFTQTQACDRLINLCAQTEDLHHSKKFKTDLRQQQSLLGRSLTRALLSRACRIPPAAWRLEIPEKSPPRAACDPQNEEWFFSISHSQNFAVAAISKIGPIGIDVEKTSASRNMGRLLAGISENPDSLPKTKNGQYRLWTLFEAYCKAKHQKLIFPIPEQLSLNSLDDTEDNSQAVKIDAQNFITRSITKDLFTFSICQEIRNR